MRSTVQRSFHGRSRGQALVEFSAVLFPFLLIVLFIIDGGRAVFAYNQMSQISRDVARVASVTCSQTTPYCATTAGSPIAIAMANSITGTQGPITWTVQCVDPTTDQVVTACAVGDLVRVNVTQQFNLVFQPPGDTFGTVNVGSTSEQQILQ
jgi:Flp pilus assembly protein TadG